MHYLSSTREGPSKSDNDKHLRPVVITASKRFHKTVKAALPDLQEHCIHAPSLEHIQELKALFGNELLLFVDIDSYGVSSLYELISKLEYPGEITVIGLSESSDLTTVVNYLRSGISGYFLKSEVNAELIVHIIMTLLNQGFPLSASITHKIIHELIAVQKDNYAALLSQREQEILNRLINGRSYKIIGYELQISLETVRHHIKNIYRKLGVNSKGEVIARMLKASNTQSPFMG